MNNEPKRKDYPTDDAFIEALARHHGIDPRMCKELPQEYYLKAEIVRLKMEVERLADEIGLMKQLFEKYLTPEIRKAMVKKAKKQGGKP